MNWASWLFLLASLWGAWFAYNAVVPQRRGVYLASWSFVAGWLTGDLAVHHIAWQALATVVFVAFGALEALPGQLALAVTCASWLALAWTQLRSAKATGICEAALRKAFAAGGAGTSSLAAAITCSRRADGPQASNSSSGSDSPDSSEGSEGSEGSNSSDSSKLTRLAFVIPRLPDRVERIADIQYGRACGLDLRLDVYSSRDGDRNRPVLFQIHGGAWVAETKDHQALPLMHHLASNGWVCVSLNYRLSPHATFPDHMIDSKRALAWVKEHIAGYGGNPDFIVVTGGSAGGHLAALTALTPNVPEYQPELAHVDTSVQGCIPFYGVYDLTGETEEHDAQAALLEKYVIKGSRVEMSEAYDRASPILQVGDHAPPFFVIHGDCDTVVPVDQARTFVRELRGRSLAPVAYAELPGAQHAFDVFHTVRTAAVVDAVERFANTLHRSYRWSAHAREAVPASGRARLRAV